MKAIGDLDGIDGALKVKTLLMPKDSNARSKIILQVRQRTKYHNDTKDIKDAN